MFDFHKSGAWRWGLHYSMPIKWRVAFKVCTSKQFTTHYGKNKSESEIVNKFRSIRNKVICVVARMKKQPFNPFDAVDALKRSADHTRFSDL